MADVAVPIKMGASNSNRLTNEIVEDTLFRALAEQHSEPLLVLDVSEMSATGQIVFANEAVVTQYGFSLQDLLGRNAEFLEETPDSDVGGRLAGIAPLTQEHFRRERKHRRRDGSVFPVELEGRVVEWHGRRLAMVLMKDQTQLLLLKEQEQKRQADLSRVAHLVTLGQMASRITHEISQPLFAITNYTSACVEVLSKSLASVRKGVAENGTSTPRAGALREAENGLVVDDITSVDDPSKQWCFDFQEASTLLDWLKQVATQSSRAGEVLRTLANFTRAAPVNRVTTTPERLVQQAVDFLNADLCANEVKLRYEIESGLEPLVCEPILIEQVLVNLIRNGSEAMAVLEKDQRRLLVRVRQAEKFLEFAVIDGGPAVEMEVVRNTFDSFFTTGAEGRGRGFAINRTIIEAQGGRLWAEKNPSQGMAVSFTLPFTRSTESATHVL